MSSSPFGFATRVSLSLSLFSLSSTRISLSSPRVVSALVALDVHVPSPPSCRYLPPNIFSISFISSLLPESSPPLEYTLTFYFPLLVVKPTNPPRPFFFLRSCFSYVYPPPLLFVPFLAPRAEGFTSSKQQTERGREGEGRREGGLRSNRSDLRPASEKGNLGEPHTTTTTEGEGEGPVDNERPAGR